MLEKSAAAASSPRKLSWLTSTERRVEAKSRILLHEPKKAVEADGTDPKPPKQNGEIK